MTGSVLRGPVPGPVQSAAGRLVPGPAPVVDVAVLAVDYAAGQSLRRCGSWWGISAAEAARLLRGAGVGLRVALSCRAGSEPGVVAEAYRGGLTLAQCAARFQVSIQTVVRRLDEAGVPRRGLSRPRSEPAAATAEMAAAYLAGHTLAWCGAAWGISAAAAGRRLDEAGIPRRPRTRQPPPLPRRPRRARPRGAASRYAGACLRFRAARQAGAPSAIAPVLPPARAARSSLPPAPPRSGGRGHRPGPGRSRWRSGRRRAAGCAASRHGPGGR